MEVRVEGRDKRAAAVYRYLHWSLRYSRRQVEPAVEQALLNRLLYGNPSLQEVVQRFRDAVPILRR